MMPAVWWGCDILRNQVSRRTTVTSKSAGASKKRKIPGGPGDRAPRFPRSIFQFADV